MNYHKVQNVVNPTLPQDAATKNYVDDKRDYTYRQVIDFHEGVQINRLDQMQQP